MRLLGSIENKHGVNEPGYKAPSMKPVTITDHGSQVRSSLDPLVFRRSP
jgi:hypothetical protein